MTWILTSDLLQGGWGGDLVPICRVPLITSQKEELALINANNMKPVVKLLINRHNNKYSYTGASDDNLLKNIELFDKLSLRLEEGVDSRRMRRVEKLFLALKVFHLFCRPQNNFLPTATPRQRQLWNGSITSFI